jgi:putative colanic acid biosynthesis UDP-glucose lipid carrier transferase
MEAPMPLPYGVVEGSDLSTLSSSVSTHFLPMRRLERTSTVAERRALLAIGLICADFGGIIVSAISAYSYRYETIELPFNHLLLAVLAAIVFVNAMRISEGYTVDAVTVWAPRFGIMLITWSAVLVGVIALAYFFKISGVVSRMWIGVWWLTGAALLFISRVFAAAVVFRWRHEGKLVTRVALVGSSARIAQLAARWSNSADPSIELIAAFDQELEAGGPGSHFDELVSLARTNGVDEIVIATPTLAEPQLQILLRTLGSFAVNVRLYPDFFSVLPAPGKIDMLGGTPMLSVVETPLVGWKRIAKRAEDIVLSSIGILLSLPLMLLIAVAIKLDSNGPVLFCQTRFGFNSNPICVYKFRTMAVSSALDREAPQARRGDNRVTRVGRFLRRSSLDELPQLFNVLLGDMSLVGPRPHPVALNERFAGTIDDYLARHRVKPGITGWAQVNGLRGETETIGKMQQRLEYDLNYIKNWSVLFDLRILVLTMFVGFVHENAY